MPQVNAIKRRLGGLNLRRTLTTLLLIVACGDTATERYRPLYWTLIDVPAQGVMVFEGSTRAGDLKAWYVDANLNQPALRSAVVMAPDGHLDTPTSLAAAFGACVLINGGGFRTDGPEPRHIGLLKMDGILFEEPIPSVLWDGDRYHVARGAFGLTVDKRPIIGWIRMQDQRLRSASSLPRHQLGDADPLFTRSMPSEPWLVRDALGAGPVLVAGSEVKITAPAEGFWSSSLQALHPRSAIGYTVSNHLIFLVVDGRQEASRGISIAELAQHMRDLGSVMALNLDGGGSSALVVGGRLLNRPEGNQRERPVMSAIALICDTVD